MAGQVEAQAFVTLSLLTYCPTDHSILFDISPTNQIVNSCGYLGAKLAGILFYFFGHSAYLFVPTVLIILAGCLGCFSISKNKDRLFALVGLIFTSSLIENFYSVSYFSNLYPGGTIGYVGVNLLNTFFDTLGTTLFLYVSTLVLLVLADNLNSTKLIQPLVKYLCYPLFNLAFNFLNVVYISVQELLFKIFKKLSSILNWQENDLEEPDELWQEVENIFSDPFWKYSVENAPTEHAEKNILPVLAKSKNSEVALKELDVFKPMEYELPLNIFSRKKSLDQNKKINKSKEDDQSSLLEQKLTRFGIKGKVISITSGPIVTLYEYAPEPEIKISTILAREDDLALALQALSLRIIAPIPGKSVVGFEVAHHNPEPVMFYDLINQAQEKIKNLSIPLLLGTDTQGLPVVADLIKLPHLLLAGTTGSGKSVAVQNMIMTILCHKSPDVIKLILIDPKRLELSVYQDIGHLLFPVVTEPKYALAVLNWALGIMEERYTVLSKSGVKNCLEYHELDEENKYKMPFIVIIIDELADLMMTAGKELEISLVRLAQMARASGIHLITATQRPSVDVVTGLIKINFPSRLACKVASKIDSRTILDCAGAEKLLGRGDMLFLSPNGFLQRLHGAYITSAEIELVANKIREQCTVEYEQLENNKKDLLDIDEHDELFDQAIEFIKTRNEVSISLIQRKFKIGYNRSARLIEQLEASGHVLPPSGSKMRKVNINSDAHSNN